MQTERSKDKALLSKYSKLNITLDDSQHDEMCKIVTELEDKHIMINWKKFIRKLMVLEWQVQEVWLMDKQK